MKSCAVALAFLSAVHCASAQYPFQLAPEVVPSFEDEASLDVELAAAFGANSLPSSDDDDVTPESNLLPNQLTVGDDSVDTGNKPLPMQLAVVNDDDTVAENKPLPKQLAAGSDDSVDMEFIALPIQDAPDKNDDDTETENKPLPKQLAPDTDDAIDTENKPLPMQLAAGTDDATDAVIEPLPMQFALDNDDDQILENRPLPMQLPVDTNESADTDTRQLDVDADDDAVSENKPLPMQLALDNDDDAVSENKPLPKQLVPDTDPIIEMAFSAGFVEMPDDELMPIDEGHDNAEAPFQAEINDDELLTIDGEDLQGAPILTEITNDKLLPIDGEDPLGAPILTDSTNDELLPIDGEDPLGAPILTEITDDELMPIDGEDLQGAPTLTEITNDELLQIDGEDPLGAPILTDSTNDELLQIDGEDPLGAPILMEITDDELMPIDGEDLQGAPILTESTNDELLPIDGEGIAKAPILLQITDEGDVPVPINQAFVKGFVEMPDDEPMPSYIQAQGKAPKQQMLIDGESVDEAPDLDMMEIPDTEQMLFEDGGVQEAPSDYGFVEIQDNDQMLINSVDLAEAKWEQITGEGELGTRHLRGNGRSLVSPSDPSTWVVAHNTRRTKLFLDNGLGPADLVWSKGIQASAESYVQVLLNLDKCTIQHGLDGWQEGENLAAAWARPKGSYVRTPTDSVQAWFEGEQSKGFGSNGHFTQVGWRATKYFACASGTKDYSGGECFIDVCRYIKPGNCNIKSDNWMQKMLSDDSPCGSECPPEGCGAANVNQQTSTTPPSTPTTSSTSSTTVTGSTITPLDSTEWLDAHNSRRTMLYAANNLTPKDLRWSSTTAESALSYLGVLLALDGCRIEHHLDDWSGGENLAAGWASKKGYNRRNTDVVKGWFEGEQNLEFGSNGHYTQVGWRPSRYLGCASGKKDFNGGECFIEVCRYVRPGNCNIDASTWKTKMLARKSPCGPICPEEGCF